MIRKYRGEILMLIVSVIAAAGWFFSKNSIAEMPSVGFIGLRFGIAALLLLPFSCKRLKALTAAQTLRASAVGFALTFNISFWVLAITYSNNFGEGAFIMSLSMLIAPLLFRLLFKRRPPRVFWLSMLIAVIGLYILAADKFNRLSFDTGTILFFLTALSAALFFVLSGRYADNIPTMPLLTIQFMLVSLCCGLYSRFFESWPPSISLATWLWFAASTLIATNFRYFLQIQGLRYCNIVTAALIMVLEPVWTLIFSVMLLDEPLSLSKALGCSLILSAIIIYRLPTFLKRSANPGIK